jgi:hypothetical protein
MVLIHGFHPKGPRRYTGGSYNFPTDSSQPKIVFFCNNQYALSDAEICCETLPMRRPDRFVAARPLLEFGWAAVEG